MRIAIVEDDAEQAEYLDICLRAIGASSYVFCTGRDAIKGLQKDSFDLILLDWILPDIGGDVVLRWIRENIDWKVPVIFVTQRDSSEDLVYALGHGADDYVTKPIKPVELVARIQAVVRRASGVDPAQKIYEFSRHRLDLVLREISVDGQVVSLTQKEFDLASFLFRHLGRLLSRPHLLESVWGHGDDLNTRTLDTHVSRIRKKLQLVPEAGWRLSSVYHHGYRLEEVAVTVVEESPVI